MATTPLNYNENENICLSQFQSRSLSRLLPEKVHPRCLVIIHRRRSTTECPCIHSNSPQSVNTEWPREAPSLSVWKFSHSIGQWWWINEKVLSGHRILWDSVDNCIYLLLMNWQRKTIPSSALATEVEEWRLMHSGNFLWTRKWREG